MVLSTGSLPLELWPGLLEMALAEAGANRFVVIGICTESPRLACWLMTPARRRAPLTSLDASRNSLKISDNLDSSSLALSAIAFLKVLMASENIDRPVKARPFW